MIDCPELLLPKTAHLYLVLNALSHPFCEQTNGFSFVWTRTWIFNEYEVRNALPHPFSLHLNLYSPRYCMNGEKKMGEKLQS